MIRRHMLCLPLVLAPLFGWSQEATDGPSKERREPTTLETVMEGMKDNLKGVAMTLRDETKRTRTLEHVAALQSLALEAKGLVPANLESKAKDERAAHTEAYRRDMNALLVVLLELEIDVFDDDTKAAWAKITGSLFEMRETSHEKYQ